LGVTIHCAQCHNHRFDPIPQADYFRLRAVFEPAFDVAHWRAPATRRISLMTGADREKSDRIEKEAHVIDVQRLKKQFENIERTFQKQLLKVPEEKRKEVEAAFRAETAKRTPAQVDLMRKYPFTNVTPGSLYLYDKKAADELAALSAQAAK